MATKKENTTSSLGTIRTFLIPVCCYLWHDIDMGKVTGNQRMEKKMKRIFTLTIVLMAFTACSVFPVEKTESSETATPPNMPNPAAVDCEIGKQLAIQTADDGSQSSESVFPEGSGGYMPPESTEAFANWWGVIKSTEPGAQYDDYFERQDMGEMLYFGIDSLDPAVQVQIAALRDTGKVVHLYGTLFSNVIDYNGSQVQVEHIEVEE